jgi:hypothetical protein
MKKIERQSHHHAHHRLLPSSSRVDQEFHCTIVHSIPYTRTSSSTPLSGLIIYLTGPPSKGYCNLLRLSNPADSYPRVQASSTWHDVSVAVELWLIFFSQVDHSPLVGCGCDVDVDCPFALIPSFQFSVPYFQFPFGYADTPHRLLCMGCLNWRASRQYSQPLSGYTRMLVQCTSVYVLWVYYDPSFSSPIMRSGSLHIGGPFFAQCSSQESTRSI